MKPTVIYAASSFQGIFNIYFRLASIAIISIQVFIYNDFTKYFAKPLHISINLANIVCNLYIHRLYIVSLATSNVLKVNDMCNFLAIIFL